MKIEKLVISVASTLIVFGITIFPCSVDAKKPFLTVNCDVGQSLQAAIDSAKLYEPLELKVLGTCNENVFIRRDGITINGNTNATVVGTIDMRGADRIEISNITLTGPGYGAVVIGGEVILRNVTATQNENWSAIAVSASGSLEIVGSDISNNQGNGVFVGVSSSLHTAGGTVISDNQGAGISADLNASAIIWDGTSIHGNWVGILAQQHSIVLLENADVSNNIYAGIELKTDGGAILRGENTVIGNPVGVYCDDFESSYQNVGTPITDAVICSGF